MTIRIIRKSITQRIRNHWKKPFQRVFMLPHQRKESQIKGKVSSLSHAKEELSFPSSIKSELWSFYVKFRVKCGFKTSPRIYYVCSVLSAGLMLED